MAKLKNLLPFLFLIVVAAAAILQLFPSYHRYGGVKLPSDARAIEESSRALLASMAITLEGMTAQTQLVSDDALFRQVEQKYGIERANALMRENLPVYRWEIRWGKPTDLIFSSGRRADDSKVEQTIAEMIRGKVFVKLGPAGQLLELERKIADSIPLPNLSQPEARLYATSILRSFAKGQVILADSMQPSSEKRNEQKTRVDYEFVWPARQPITENPAHVTVSLAGNQVTLFKVETEIPEAFKSSEIGLAWRLGLPILYAAAILVMIFIAFRRFRAFELGFRLAIVAGLVVAFATLVVLYLSMRMDRGWEILIPLIFGPLLYGGTMVLVWAVSESVAREMWKEKLISLDLLSKGHGFHSRVGESLVRGIALGSGSLALFLMLAFVASKIVHVSSTSPGDSAIDLFGTESSWLYVLGNGVTSIAFKLSIVFVFVISFLRSRISSPMLLLLLSSVIVALTSKSDLTPALIGYLSAFLVSAVTVWGFYRYDTLVAILSLFTYIVLEDAAGLLSSGNSTYAVSGFMVIGVLGVVFIIGLATQSRKREITDFGEIMPAFAKHITERQRLQQELEIARSVQMSFLPKSNPKVIELDIASRCAPALEVGGDYYDFLDVGEKKLGIVVGDVSGKGTQAAFFMTLTKGFVHALAEVSASPSAVLTQVNKLFYENVDRGVFISMVYGIFDTGRRILTVARAGHNPVIMRKTQTDQVQVINPMGLALGLDAGDTFSKSIQEVAIPFQSGDLFVFYTDGFPEAMNQTLEEFGEERLGKTVQKYAHLSAVEIMDGIFAETKQFVGRAKQHDDMTIVVVKIV